MFQPGSRSARAADSAAPGAEAPSVEVLRRQARRRLLGAAVLVGAAVVVLPWLLEAQPRPVPVDVTIEIPARDAAPPLPAPVPRSEPVEEVLSVDRAAVAAPQAPAPQPSPEPTPAPASAAGQAASAAPAAPASPAEVAAAKPRVVVQVGAYAEPARAQEVRKRLESAGLKTYTHVAETPQGKRIRVRVGPFDSRAEAEKVADKVKALGLPAAVLTL